MPQETEADSFFSLFTGFVHTTMRQHRCTVRQMIVQHDFHVRHPADTYYAGIGRSSDFVLLTARLPGIRVFQWLTLYYIYKVHVLPKEWTHSIG